MPTYQFRCPDGTIVEQVFKISEVPETIPSPNGDGEAVRIISGGAGLIFKGSGFYITDYGKDGKKDQRQQGAGDKGEGAKPEPVKGEATAGGGGGKSEGSKGGADATKAAAPSLPPTGGKE